MNNAQINGIPLMENDIGVILSSSSYESSLSDFISGGGNANYPTKWYFPETLPGDILYYHMSDISFRESDNPFIVYSFQSLGAPVLKGGTVRLNGNNGLLEFILGWEYEITSGEYYGNSVLYELHVEYQTDTVQGYLPAIRTRAEVICYSPAIADSPVTIQTIDENNCITLPTTIALNSNQSGSGIAQDILNQTWLGHVASSYNVQDYVRVYQETIDRIYRWTYLWNSWNSY